MPLLGCIADDFTGATDLASMLVRNGMRTVQVIGVPAAERPGEPGPLPEADAVVVALKSRTIPAADAIAQSLAACEALLAAGAKQILHKYCSTFDSTDQGNIGPVAEALLERLQGGLAIACPAFPTNGRTVFQGHLFVGSALLSESGMQDHPLTPMTDPSLVRVLARQSTGSVGLLPFAVVEAGEGAIRRELAKLGEWGKRLVVADAVTDAHLVALGAACANHPLITGGSGIAMGLPENFRRAGLLEARADADALPAVGGACAVLAGSCSRATLGQVGAARGLVPTLELDALATPDAGALVAQAAAWMEGKLSDTRPVVIVGSAVPEKVQALQAKLGREAAGALVEEAMAGIAALLAERGVRRLLVAGGETSGAVVQRLGVRSLRIGAEIDPGVPWCWTEAQGGMHLALKSGNFGGRDMFTRAFDHG